MELRFIYGLIIFLLSLNLIYPQIAVIQDEDGFVNVRMSESQHSEVKFTISNNQVFFYDLDYYKSDREWIAVRVPENLFTKYNSTYSNKDKEGFIHRSRIKILESLPKDQADCPILTFRLNKAGTLVPRDFGVFGLEIPISISTEVTSLSLEWRESKIHQQSFLYNDLFNVSSKIGTYTSQSEKFICYKQEGTYYINQKCADGAGYYEIVWVIKNGVIIQRLVGWI